MEKNLRGENMGKKYSPAPPTCEQNIHLFRSPLKSLFKLSLRLIDAGHLV